MRIDPATIRSILAAVDTVLPAGAASIWLTGSRIRGNARPDSDWDVIAFHPEAPKEQSKLFECGQIIPFAGSSIELVIAHPEHWNDPRRYMAECRKSGLRLR